jgi:histidinol-phosphatase (PHP family)
VDVRLGLEVDFFPGLEFWYEDLLSREPLHYVLGSVHPYSLYESIYFTGDWPAYHRQYFASLVESAESGYFDCLAHPDLIKIWGVEEYDLTALMDHIRTCLDRIAETGVAMELNTSGVNKKSGEMNPSPEILREMCLREIPVVVGADAHSPERVADGYLEAFDLLESAGYDRTHLFLDRKIHSISLDDARAKLLPSS